MITTKIRIAAVSYLNTLPFVYGLQQHPLATEITLTLAVPSVCARLLHEKKVDLALLPSGALTTRPNSTEIFTKFCIGARKQVDSVCIFAQTPIQCIQRLYLDPDSRTSVLLAQVLISKYWNLHPQILPLSPQILTRGIGINEAVLLIGDKVFEKRTEFTYSYDLATAWFEYTHLPFVFAIWATTLSLPKDFILLFQQALEYGIEHIPEALATSPLPYNITHAQALEYLRHRIDYSFDREKHIALERFLHEVKQLSAHSLN